MKKIYDAIIIAKWIINKIHPEPLQLQKILCLAQGYSFAFHDQPLFSNDIESWVHGPVVPEVYKLYKNYEYNPIPLSYENIKLDKDTIDILNYVIDKYSKYDAKTLEKLTHNQEPWISSRNGLNSNQRSHKVIDKKNIANYFINDVFQPDEEEWD